MKTTLFIGLNLIDKIILQKNNNRDIKPENILFQTEEENSLIKIIDFGLAKNLKNKFFHKKKGTTQYMSPEVIRENYNEKCDVWSSGVLFYLMFTKSYPFQGATADSIEFQILNSNLTDFFVKIEENKMIPEGAKQLLHQMLEYEIEQRITMGKAFHNNWIQELNLNKSIDESVVEKTLKNLLHIKFERKLQEFIWMFFINNFSSTIFDNKFDILHVFQSLDLNGDGILSKDELILAYSKILGNFKKAEKYTDKILKYLDSNKNGSIEFSEFIIGALCQGNFLTKKKLRIGFQMFDKV